MPIKSSDAKWVRFQQKMYHINSQNITLIYTNYKIDSCNKRLHHWPYAATSRGFLVCTSSGTNHTMTCGPYALILGINKVSWASHLCSFWLAVALDAVEVIWHLNRWWGRCLACISPFCLCFCFGARDPSSPPPTDVAMSHNLHTSPALSIGITRHATLPPVPTHLACAQLRASPGGRHKHNTTDGDGLSELGHGIPDSSSSRSRTVSSRRDSAGIMRFPCTTPTHAPARLQAPLFRLGSEWPLACAPYEHSAMITQPDRWSAWGVPTGERRR
jgi:hypothetical protein